jgi:PAS domain S-box-containing protein
MDIDSALISESPENEFTFIEKLKIPGLAIVILIVFLTFLFYFLDIEASYDPENLSFFLNLIFIGIPSVIIAFVAMRSFLKSGAWPVLWMGIGTLSFGLSTLISSFLIGKAPVNDIITLHNLIIFFASLLYFLGAFFMINRVNQMESKSGRRNLILQVYLGSLIFILFITTISVQGFLPPFFIQGEGGTTIRHIVLGLTAFLFWAASFMILKQYFRTNSIFIYWYGLGLLLISLGIMGILLENSMGTPLSWLGRGAQLMGGVYLIIATMVVVKEARTRNIAADEALSSFFSLKKSNLEQLLKNVSDAIIITDSNLHIIGWNKAAEDIYGWKAEEVLGKPEMEFLETKYPTNINQKHLLNDLNLKDSWNAEVIQKNKDNEDINILTSISSLKDEKDNFNGTIAINRDITLRKKTEEKAEKQARELEKSNAELENFAYVASHDLREPLRMITSFLQLLKQRYDDKLDEDAQEFIEFAVDGAKRLDNMITDLLEYSRVTSQKRDFVPVNCEKVLEETLMLLKVPIDENNAIITYDSLPTVLGDDKLMVQVFQNLLSNSIKYRGLENPHIHISVKKENKSYIFSVKDNGIGMDPKHLKRIFTIFQRLHKRDEYEGTGIGLSIVQKIVHQFGGEIWVESEPGKGSTFYFTVPDN